jgi:hypothetical protein
MQLNLFQNIHLSDIFSRLVMILVDSYGFNLYLLIYFVWERKSSGVIFSAIN